MTSVSVPAADDSAGDADEQYVISVQISKSLQPQLFNDLSRAKKRDRAERLRWLCLYGLAAEAQAVALASDRREQLSTAAPGCDGSVASATEPVHPNQAGRDRADQHAPVANGADLITAHPDVNDLFL